MTIWRNIKDGRLYLLYRVTSVMGCWEEAEDFITGARRKLNQSSFRIQDFVPKYHR